MDNGSRLALAIACAAFFLAAFCACVMIFAAVTGVYPSFGLIGFPGLPIAIGIGAFAFRRANKIGAWLERKS